MYGEELSKVTGRVRVQSITTTVNPTHELEYDIRKTSEPIWIGKTLSTGRRGITGVTGGAVLPADAEAG
jgi:hypothetical protein